MKNKKNNKKAFVSVVLSILIIVLFLIAFWMNIQKRNTILQKTVNGYPKNIFYKVFGYSNYLSSIQEFYEKKANEITKKAEIKKPIDSEKIIEQEKPTQNNNKHKNENRIEEESIIINSSLTSTPGSISVYGKSNGINLFYQGKQINIASNEFQFTAGISYTIEIKGRNINKKVTISSPAYGTNKIISQLTLQVNPITMSATIIGKLNLMLPGDIKGSLYNLSNSSSSSTVLQKGYFATSVTLQKGTNILTATGEWFTIKLDLPSIQVIVTE
jgi:hypothetical protein